MINKLKNNSKIKIISLLSAMVLWMYVMAIVDPEETKLFENIKEYNNQHIQQCHDYRDIDIQ